MVSYNGEHFFAKEWGVAAIRHTDKLDEQATLLHPADVLGDVGAAFAPLAIGLVVMGLHQKKLNDPALICCSSDGEQRAAVYLTHMSLLPVNRQ